MKKRAYWCCFKQAVANSTCLRYAFVISSTVYQLQRDRLSIHSSHPPFFEKRALLSSDAIIAICPYLGEHVRESGVTRKVFVIENTPEADTFFSNNSPGKSEVELPPEIKSRPVVLYAGTFEHYQGLDLLMESIPLW